MRLNYVTDEDNRLIALTEYPLDEDKPIIELDSTDIVITDYKVIDGSLIYDPIPKEEVTTEPTNSELSRKMDLIIELLQGKGGE